MVECPAPGLYSDQLPQSSQLKGELQVLQCGSSLCPHSASTLPRVPIQSDPYQYSIKFAPQLAGEKFNEPANRYLEVIPRPISTNLSCISGMMTAVTPPQAPGPISIMKIITSIYIPWIHSASTQGKYPITPLFPSLSPHCSTFWIHLKFKCPLVPGCPG